MNILDKEDTSENIQACGYVTWLSLQKNEELLGELLSYNTFMHMNEMAMNVRWPSPCMGYCIELPWHLEHSGFGHYNINEQVSNEVLRHISDLKPHVDVL